MKSTRLYRWLPVALTLAVSALIGCYSKPRVVTTDPDVYHFALVREFDADGVERAKISLENLPIAQDGRSLVHFSVVGSKDEHIENDSLSALSKTAQERPNSLVVAGPNHGVAPNRWILYLAANLEGRSIEFDIQGVDEVDFADGEPKRWPLLLQKNGVALDVTFEKGGRKAHINECLQTEF